MKKLILISALLFSFNGWADDLICRDDTSEFNWFEITIKDYKDTSGLVYRSEGIKKRGKNIDSVEPPTKYNFNRVVKNWWFEYMLEAPHMTENWYLNYDPERNILHNLNGKGIYWKDYDTCEIKKTN